MKSSLFIFLLLMIFIALQGQSDTTITYKGLETKKTYAVGILSSTSNGQVSKYELNGREIDKATYDKYHSTWKNMESCCPCILKSYNENDILVSEAVQCTDCGVGWFKEYYPNGNLRLTGKYKENPTGNWGDIWNRRYCNIEEGKWIYYNEKGEQLYSEFWKDGAFVKQVPEQSKSEIWDISIVLNGIKIDTQRISINEIRSINIIPKYKNRNIDAQLRIKFGVSAVGYKINEKEFSMEAFKNIDINKMLSEVGIPKEEETSFTLSVLANNGEYVRHFYLKVIK